MQCIYTGFSIDTAILISAFHVRIQVTCIIHVARLVQPQSLELETNSWQWRATNMFTSSQISHPSISGHQMAAKIVTFSNNFEHAMCA